MPVATHVPLETYTRIQARSGDIILFEGTSWQSTFIRCFSSTKYSHTAVVCVVKKFDGLAAATSDMLQSTVGLYVLESNPQDPTLHGLVFPSRATADGPQISILRERLSAYNGQVFVRRRKVKAPPIENGTLLARTAELIRESYSYCDDLSTWTKTFFRTNAKDCDNKDRYCVNFVADVLASCGNSPVLRDYNNLSLTDMAEYPLINYESDLLHLTF